MKKFLKVIIALVKKYPEVLSVPCATVAWVLSVPLFRMLDPTSAVFDTGVFQIPIFAVLQLFVYVSIAWLLLGLVFGTARKYLKTDFKTEFKSLSPWQKVRLAYWLFFCLLFALVLLSYTLR